MAEKIIPLSMRIYSLYKALHLETSQWEKRYVNRTALGMPVGRECIVALTIYVLVDQIMYILNYLVQTVALIPYHGLAGMLNFPTIYAVYVANNIK